MVSSLQQYGGEPGPGAEVTIDGLADQVKRIADRAAAVGQAYGPIVAHLACMRAAGWQIGDYGALMTVSGYGLCFCYDPGTPGHDGAHRVLPNAESRMTEATGFAWAWTRCDDAEACWQSLVEALDAGKPLRATRGRGALIAGYRAANSPHDRQVMLLSTEPDAAPRSPQEPQTMGESRWLDWGTFNAWCQDRLAHGPGIELGWHTRRRFVTSTWEIAPMVMHNAVEWATTCPDGLPMDPAVTACGLAGIRAYAADLRNLARGTGYFGPGWLGGPAVRPQWAARRATADYLMQVIEAFPAESRAAIAMAATSYRAAYGAWLDWDDHLGHGSPEAWADAQNRRAGARAVRRAARHETEAIATMASALAIMEGRA